MTPGFAGFSPHLICLEFSKFLWFAALYLSLTMKTNSNKKSPAFVSSENPFPILCLLCAHNSSKHTGRLLLVCTLMLPWHSLVSLWVQIFCTDKSMFHLILSLHLTIWQPHPSHFTTTIDITASTLELSSGYIWVFIFHWWKCHCLIYIFFVNHVWLPK